jgi:hypothetical protein
MTAAAYDSTSTENDFPKHSNTKFNMDTASSISISETCFSDMAACITWENLRIGSERLIEEQEHTVYKRVAPDGDERDGSALLACEINPATQESITSAISTSSDPYEFKQQL